MDGVLHRLNRDIASLVAQVLPSLVTVSNGHEGRGAGTIWHPDGLILTNAHVVGRRRTSGRRRRVGEKGLLVKLADGREVAARVIALDPARDLAALAIEASALPAIPLGDSRKLTPGQWVVAVGHPWGVQGAATMGTIIDSGRPLEFNPYEGELIQTGLQLRPGHSGGPLLDVAGRLIGINTMIAGPHVGLAIPVETVRSFLKSNLGSKERVWPRGRGSDTD